MKEETELKPAIAGFHQRFPTFSFHRFSHHAMAALFEVYCVHPEKGYALQAATAAFDVVDRLEQDLSRFIENSDILHIGRLHRGESTRVSQWTMDCLAISRFAYSETCGAFDVSLGAGLNNLDLLPLCGMVSAKGDAIRLDLGGIGKGYAVDRIAEVLREWDINVALIHGGFSSVLALDPPSGYEGWPVTMSFPQAGGRVFASVQASHRVFSASGMQKGDHIVDPRTDEPARLRRAAWVSGEKDVFSHLRISAQTMPEKAVALPESPATLAEALSTAFMILETEQIEDYCRKHAGLEAWLLHGDESILTVGSSAHSHGQYENHAAAFE